MKKLLLIGLVLLFAGSALASDLVFLEPDKRQATGPVATGELDDWFWIMQTLDDAAEYYLGSGAADDTLLTVFTPLAACSIFAVEHQWYTAGPYQAFIWLYPPETEAEYPDGIPGERGSTNLSPAGELLVGPVDNAAEGSGEWETFISTDDMAGGLEVNPVQKFSVGFVKSNEDGTPNPLADDVTSRGFAYTWLGGPWNAEQEGVWGVYSHSVDLTMRVGINYPWGAPPVIGNLTQLPNTINGNKSCYVKVPVSDDVEWTFDHHVYLYWSVNGGEPESMEMFDPEGELVFGATFTLDGLAPGDLVEYWVEAIDDEGLSNSTELTPKSFQVIGLNNPTAPVLVIEENSTQRADILHKYFHDSNYTYEYYYTAENKGIDQYIVDHGWEAVFVIGWGCGSVPTRDYAGSAYANYVDGGGHFFFSDQDYFFANAEVEEPNFADGDFAYDILGIQDAYNDPADEEGNSISDSTYYGEPGDPLGDLFVDEPFWTQPNALGQLLWADYCEPKADADLSFTHENLGEGAGITYERGDGGWSFFLSFDLQSAADSLETPETIETPWGEEVEVLAAPTAQFVALMDAAMEAFGVTDAPEQGDPGLVREFSLAQNYPNPFNPSTQISFTVPVRSHVSVKVYNTAGQLVATLADRTMSPGAKSLNFDASSLASGVYFYRMEAQDFTATKKMVLLK